MSARLIPCSSCDRHFRLSEAACPFCGASTPAPSDLAPVVPPPAKRLGRAALFAFGAAAAGVVAVAGCGDDSTVALYGAPADVGPADTGSGDGGDDAATDGAPTDAGVDAGGAALYGAPPSDAG